MRCLLLAASIVLSATSQATYVWQLYRGDTKPPFATRSALALAMLLNLLSIREAHGNAGAQVFAGLSLLQALITTALALKHTVGRPGLFDLGCLVGSVVGSVMLYETRDPTAGMTLAIAADLVAYLPYFRNAWMSPEPKVWKSFALSGASAAIGLTYDLLYFPPSLTFGYQAYILVADIVFILFNARGAPGMTTIEQEYAPQVAE